MTWLKLLKDAIVRRGTPAGGHDSLRQHHYAEQAAQQPSRSNNITGVALFDIHSFDDEEAKFSV